MCGCEWVIEAHGCDAAALADLAKLRALFTRLTEALFLHPVGDATFHQGLGDYFVHTGRFNEGFHELDTRFHRQMTEALGLARVGEVLDPIRTHLERVRRTLLPEPGRPQGTLREHEAIYAAIAARQPDQARRDMANHLDRVSRELQTFVAKHPGFFEE